MKNYQTYLNCKKPLSRILGLMGLTLQEEGDFWYIKKPGSHIAVDRDHDAETLADRWYLRDYILDETASISLNPSLRNGSPYIRGTSVTVDHVRDKIAEGCSASSLCFSAGLTMDQVNAAIAFSRTSLFHSLSRNLA